MVQFVRLESIISHGMSIPRDIRMVIPVQGVRVRMLFKPLTRKVGVHLPI
jgi:hypothetical protein